MDAAILYPQIGTKEDSANASGSLHAKTKDIKDKVNILGTSSDNRASNTVMGWLSSPIKSIQRGTGIMQLDKNEVTVTISAVTTSKTMINFLGASAGSRKYRDGGTSGVAYSVTGHHFLRLSLTNATTITVSRKENNNVDATFSYEVIEFY